ncbi:MAG: phosphoglucosamine mutase [Oscillospiraceae bacterium]|jgi:phosphoglucosamine mutase|nr:phosphoglucosamine mutase [Oscillospiraceae bacterium]
MGKYFGTDGIRGVVNKALDAELAYKAGSAAATVLAQGSGKRLRVMIAKDTRISSGMLEAALSAGLCSAGADVTLLGVLPTPAVAYLTVNSDADLGIVISASHNPFEHNGIKMFGRNGFKLNDSLEERIEYYIDNNLLASKMTGGGLGRIGGDHRYWMDEYIEYLAAASIGRYKGRIAIDCANGASSETASSLFSAIGADFQVFSDKPDGVNINNNCGSIHISALQDIMKTGNYSVGFAFDGDADRCIVVDERGETADGDIMLAAFARTMLGQNELKGGGAVGTIVSNSGMDAFARKNGFKFHRAAVGDRNVLEMMWETGCNIGGESSGHLIFSDDATTGDGQLTAIKFLNLLLASGCSVSELVADIPSYPQVMPSFVLTGGAEQRDAIMSDPRLLEEIGRQQEILADEGRVLIRPSGTEPVIRVLVEAKTERLASEKAEFLVNLMKSL